MNPWNKNTIHLNQDYTETAAASPYFYMKSGEDEKADLQKAFNHSQPGAGDIASAAYHFAVAFSHLYRINP